MKTGGEFMPYQLGWYKPEQILYLELTGQPTIQELKQVNQEVNHILDSHQRKMILLMDTTGFTAGYHSANYLRETQTYVNHDYLGDVLVISDNKLTRLITLLAFSLSRANFSQYNSMALAEKVLQRMGFRPDERVS